MKKTKVIALAIAATSVLASASGVMISYALGAFETPVVAQTEYDRTFTMTRDTTTLEGGILTHETSDHAIVEMAVTGATRGESGVITLSDGSLTATTYINQLKGIMVNKAGTGTLNLSTSRDGTNFVEVGEVGSGLITFDYAPHYFKLVATGEVSINGIILNVDCLVKDDLTFDFPTRGSFKGTVTITDHNWNPDAIEDYTVTISQTSLNFLDFDVDTGETSEITLYPIEDLNGSYTLALDANDPSPSRTWTLGKNGTYATITYEDYDNYVFVEFSGAPYVPATGLSVTVDGAAYDGGVIEVAKGGSLALKASVTPYNVTEEFTWTIASADQATIGFGSGNTYSSESKEVTVFAKEGGEAVATAKCGAYTVSVNIKVNAPTGGSVDAIPSNLVGTSWYGVSPDACTGLTVYFYSSDQVWLSDDLSYAFEEDVANFNSLASSVADGVYTLAFFDCNLGGVLGLVIEYDSNDSSMTVTAGTTNYEYDLADTVLAQIPQNS